MNTTENNLNIIWPSLPKACDLKTLLEIKKTAQLCVKCKLCETRSQVVVEDGNPSAKLLIIGEGPGEQEDLKGLPFVGKSGKLLDKILENAEISRQNDTYICNIVKCRPPENRVPTLVEIEACKPYLLSQIDIVKPKIILLLGSTSLSGLLGIKNPKITKLQGQWIIGSEGILKDIWLMPFFHPSYLLRNQSKEIGTPQWQAGQAIKEVKKKLIEFSTKQG